MTEEQRKALDELRDAGHAVCVFTPEELKGVKPKYVEEAMCIGGFNSIDWLQEDCV